MAEQIFSWILDKGASMLSDDKEANSDNLQKAIKDGDLDLVTLALGVVSDMNKMTFEGESFLSIAASGGQVGVAKLLVSKGAYIDGINNDGLTPLHVASREGHLKVVQFLASEGGDVNRQTYDGMTPLAMAAKRGHVNILTFLIVNKGVEIDVLNKQGLTPLIWACVRGFLSAANYLLSAGADVNNADIYGTTSLHYSIWSDKLDIFKSLLAASADVNRQDKKGQTPLHVACYNGRLQMLEYLLSNGADLQKAEFNGTTSLHFATAMGHYNVINIILQHTEVMGSCPGGSLRPAEAFFNYVVKKSTGMNTAGNYHLMNPVNTLSNRMAHLVFESVSDGMLNELSRRIPGYAYNMLSEKLEIDHTLANNILVRVHNDYEKATRECLSMWKVKATRSIDDLRNVLRAAELGGLIQFTS